MIQTIELATLATVTGGASKSSQLTQSLSAIQSSISDLKNSSNNNSGSNNLLLPVMMMAMNRRQSSPAVVATPGATVVAG
jgi:hypothetical protein